MERYALSSGQAGYDRLRVLARVRRASTLDLLHRAGLGPGPVTGIDARQRPQ